MIYFKLSQYEPKEETKRTRVHFRRGFDETGYAKTIFVVDAPGDWFGTIRLDALDYKYGPINKLFPFDGGTIEY